MCARSKWQLALISAPSSTVTPGPKNTFGSISDVAAELGVVGQPDGLRRDQRRAIAHRLEARAALEDRFGDGELVARVDAQHLVLVADDDAGA